MVGWKGCKVEEQSCCAGCFSLISCATCIPSIAEQVGTRLMMGFILLENLCPSLALCLFREVLTALGSQEDS